MFYTLLITYILGGLTFFPIVLIGGLAFAYYTREPTESSALRPNVASAKVEEKPPAAWSTAAASLRSPPFKSWLTVRRSFEPSPSSYISLVRTLLDSRSSHPRRAEDAYYAVLKGAVLYLYEDEAMSDCAAAIDVARCSVRVYPEEGLLDGELFAKRNALLIREKVTEGEDETFTSPPVGTDPQSQLHMNSSIPEAPWFIFFRSVTLMEDWYFALLDIQRISISSTTPAPATVSETSAPYPYAAHQALIASLDALPDLIPTRWLNAILGRLFLGVKGTRAVEAWVIGRLMKKLAKVKTPGFLNAIVVRSFDAGDVAPVLSKPMLKELTPEGETSIGVDVSYVAPPGGEMRITISATAAISLPSTASLSLLGFSGGRNKDKEREHDDEKEKHGEDGKAKGNDKADGKEKDAQRPYEVSLVLAIVVRRLEGNMLFKIKRPPSNRLWYAFTTAPHMEVTVEPVVSDRRVRWGMVLAAIEGKLKEIIQESVVLPYMDDVPFFNTKPYGLRGGIFAEAFTNAWAASGEEPTTATASAATAATTTATTTATTATTPSLNVASTASAAEGDLNTSRETTHNTSANQLHRTRSVGALVAHEEDRGRADEQRVMRAETIGATTNGARKRRTWFGKREGSGEDDNRERQRSYERGRGNETVGVLGSRDREAQDSAEDPSQTRSTRAMSASEGSPRVNPQPVAGAGFSSSAPSSSTSLPSPLSPSPGDLHRTSPSLHDSTRPPFSRTNSFTFTPDPPPPPTTSFLSTLKARSAGMAEKQPVLKEAMRKWGMGVNWAAGLRKDGISGRERERGRDGERDWRRERDRETEVDHGDFWSGTRESSGAEGSGRGSYAELRRKVEGRERGRLDTASVESNGTGNPSESGSGSRPIDIPGTERGGDVITPSTDSCTPSVRSDTSSSSIRKVSPPAVGVSGFISPSAPRTTTELQTTLRTPSPSPIRTGSSPPAPSLRRVSTHGALLPLPLLDEPKTPSLAAPIRAQPKAATMTIPGIHARHRGEVMALGSQPMKMEDAVEGKGAAAEGERNMGAGGTIQNVYRLFRGGNAQTQAQLEGDGDKDATSANSKHVTPSPVAAPYLSPSPGQRPAPPPLPLRTTMQPGLVQESSSADVDSPASQALKNVVQQDAARKPPPLPMRRPSEQILLRVTDVTTSSSSPASLPASPPSSVTPSTSASNALSPSDLDAMLIAPDAEPESSPSVVTPQVPLADGHEKWKPPLPPRRSDSSINNVQT